MRSTGSELTWNEVLRNGLVSGIRRFQSEFFIDQSENIGQGFPEALGCALGQLPASIAFFHQLCANCRVLHQAMPRAKYCNACSNAILRATTSRIASPMYSFMAE